MKHRTPIRRLAAHGAGAAMFTVVALVAGTQAVPGLRDRQHLAVDLNRSRASQYLARRPGALRLLAGLA